MEQFSSHPFLSAREELNDLSEDIAAARLEMLNNGATPRLKAYIDGLCKRRLEVLDRLDTRYFRLPVGVVETVVEDCDPYDMRDYNDVTPQAGSAAILNPGQIQSPAMQLGSAVHTAILEPNTFNDRYVIWRNGRRAGKVRARAGGNSSMRAG